MRLNHLSLSAMALSMPEVTGHPNAAPFSGILTRIGSPSDAPPGGAHGKRILLTAEAVERAIPSLLGMGVNVAADLDGHAPQDKVGVITSAYVEGDAVMIAGHLYEVDFPDLTARIRAEKNDLGFSFEAHDVVVSNATSDPVEVTALVFTGAAILFKDKAAYTSTSLTASADLELDMKPEELKAMLEGTVAAALEPIAARLDKIESANGEKIAAAQVVIDNVEPHAVALEKVAEDMEAAGIGVAADNGHAAVLRRMASKMRADAAMGKVPSGSYDWGYYASAVLSESGATLKPDAAAIESAVTAAMADLKTRLEAAETQLADKAGASFQASADPGRKTLPPAITALLARGAADLGEGEKMPVAKLDGILAASNIPSEERLKIKAAMRQAGALE